MCPLWAREGSSSLAFTSLMLSEPKLNTSGAQAANALCGGTPFEINGSKDDDDRGGPRHAVSEVRPRGSAPNQTQMYHLYFRTKLKRHTDACHLGVPSKSPSNYPGLSFAVRWHDPGAHAGLANCERKQAAPAAASSLLSWLITPLPTSEYTPHLTRRGTWANWEQLGSSELRAECRKGTDVAHPSRKLGIYSQFGNDRLSRHTHCSRPYLNFSHS